MKTRAALILAVLGGASSAFGQVQNTQIGVAYSITWAEAKVGASGTFRDGSLGGIGGNNNQVDPGEGALFTIKMVMNGLPGGSPATAAGDGTGNVMTWAPTILPGSSGSGTLSGFWGGDVNLTGSGAGNAAGSFSDSTTNFAAALRRKLITFTDGGGNGIPNGAGSALADIQPAQFGANAANLLHNNNSNCFSGLWIPGAAVNGNVTFNISIGSLNFLSSVAAMDDEHPNGVNAGSFTLPIALNVATSFGGGVTFPVVIPTPSSLALLGLGGLLAARRRR